VAKAGRAGSKAHARPGLAHAAGRIPPAPLVPAALAPVRGRAVDPIPSALDRLIHERLRLGIVSALAVNDTLSFNELKTLMQTTDGNLSVHARKLEDARYITCTKTFQGRVPHTQYSLTTSGRSALARYLDHMEALIRATRDR
jgi:DNA-binding HxlR family transcriptional regulator